MAKSLVVVESPTKARTIGRYLGKDRRVIASMGHVRDLPEASLGVDIGHSFAPQYIVPDKAKKTVKQLETAAKDAADIYLATDPDREGEAIAWHLAELLGKKGKHAFHRVTFHEITPRAVQASFEHPGSIREELVAAQQARRVLDRLVGYQISPLLWKDIQKGTSAGRVQSVALRLVCEREREIQAFKPVEYWDLEALFKTLDPEGELRTRLALLDGKKPEIGDKDTALQLAGELAKAAFAVTKVEAKPRQLKASPPFITSTLQQAAGSALRFGAQQTMRLAQQLYEGVELGEGGSVGLITYMRTDSFSIAQEAEAQAREYITTAYGAEYVPERPNRFRARKAAQEAHEAIRPTDVTRTPDAMAPFLNARQLRLYRLIWNRFVASQMTPARQLDHVVEVEPLEGQVSRKCTFRATSRETLFPGHLVVYNQKETEDDEEVPTTVLPNLVPGTACTLIDLGREQRFTTPPNRYTEATLIRTLEQNGVGRPSTYAATVNTIQTRGYVNRDKARLLPTPLGFSVNDYLVAHMPDLFDVRFTAEMEELLDQVEEGKVEWTTMVTDFYTRFERWLSATPALAVPDHRQVAEFLALFPEDIQWHEPVKRGRRVYDDCKFIASIRDQIEEGKKPVSERQWNALLLLAARYVPQIPGLLEKAEAFGVRKQIETHMQALDHAATEGKAGPEESDIELLAALATVTFEEPVRRGRRTFNDRRFYDSLKSQVVEGSRLSAAQQAALAKLVVKYAGQVPEFDVLRQKYNLPVTKENAAEPIEADPQVARLVDELEHITEWDAPVRRGKRVFDDSQFAASLKQQFRQKGSLSDKQLDALKRMLAKYASQIPDYETVQQELSLAPKAPEPVVLDIPCPRCQSPLVKRSSRGKQFYGCSAFPKCRFTANELPSMES